MAVKSFDCGPVEMVMGANVKVDLVAQEPQDVPGGLYPMISRAFEMDEYRIMAGWPVPVPAYEIRTNTMVSCTGERFADRDDPTAIITGAVLRWVPDATLYNMTSLQWAPIQNTTGSPVYWQTSVQYAPVFMDDYSYRNGDERFIRPALNFDSDNDNHMWCNFTSTIGGSAGYTVIMVVSPNSTFGNNVNVPYNGLWGPGLPTPLSETFAEDVGEHYFAVSIQGMYLYLETEINPRTRGIAIYPELNSNSPMMVAMVFDRPETTFYVGPGPSAIRVKSLAAGTDPVPLSSQMVLGRSIGDIKHTSDMALLDLGIYPNRLTAGQVADEFSLLSQAYGGDT